MKKFTGKYSLFSIALIVVVILFVFFYSNLWKTNRVTLDSPSYYTYLPAVFIHQDLRLDYVDRDPEFYRNKIWFYRIENNRKLIKHPSGWALAVSPFFLAGHAIAKAKGANTLGYAMSYQNAVSIGVLIWLVAGLLCLRKALLNCFSEKITALTLLLIVLATNLFWYSTFEGFMPHAVSFSLLCMSIYAFLRWLNSGERRYLVGFALAIGLSILVRPLAITVLLWFLLYAIIDKKGWKNLVAFVRPRFPQILLCGLAAVLIASIQLFYWRYVTGKWLYDVYVDEHFVFSSPQMIPFLLSFRKGLLIYSPVFLIAIIGMFVFLKSHKAMFWSLLVLMLLTIFLLSSWWAWSYGISWGLRPMIDYYSFLAFPLAAGLAFLFRRGVILRWITAAFCLLVTALSLFQTWQYSKGLIHYDDMSKESYFIGFFQTHKKPGWEDHLKPYNWQRRIKSLPQIEYSPEFIRQIPAGQPVYFRGANLLYVSASVQADFMLTCYFNDVGKEEQFFLEWISGTQVVIRSANGQYLSWKPKEHDIIVADAAQPGAHETFTIETPDDNKIILLAANGKALTIGTRPPFLIRAAAEPGNGEYFRIFVMDDHQTR